MASQIERLGVGVRSRRSRRTKRDFKEVLTRLLANDELRCRAADSGRRFAAEPDGAEAGADAICALVSQGSVAPLASE